MNDALKAAAHAYRGRGWRVIALHHMEDDGQGIVCSCAKGHTCKSAGKHPRDNAWQDTPAPSAADIEAIWDQHPNANIGIATGKPSGLWALDIDPGSGGMESMAALVAIHGPLPTTFVAQTGSGGYHYLWAMPEGMELRNSAGRVGKGIDTRADGGQIVAPPSVSGKGTYTVVVDAPLAQAPDWLLEAARKTDVSLPVVTAIDLPKPEDFDPAEWTRLNNYAADVVGKELGRLDRLKSEGWDGEPWNHTTFHVACSLIEMANSTWNSYSMGHAQADLLARAPRDNDGFDTTVVMGCWESAASRIGANARAVPADRSNEPDPLFNNPEIRQRPEPGDGGETDPVVGREVTEWDFFDKKDLLAANLANAIIERGPIGWGTDRDFWKYADGVWVPDEYVVRHRTVNLLGDRYRQAHYNTVKDIVQMKAQQITGDPLVELMNFGNGMLDWKTGDLLAHDPAYASTVRLGCDWVPDATCPRFEEFLDDVMHQDYVDLAWEMLGYLIMSGNPQETAFLFYGVGGNGKSTLIDLIKRMLGADNIASESLNDLNGNRFRAASLFGRIANLAGDIDATYQENTATFKRLTGEDEITAEHKHAKPFRFLSWAVNVFSANKFPGSADVTEGYLRRWIVLHFHKTIPVERRIDRGVLMSMFEAELPGIAAKAVRHLRIQQDRGHFDPKGEAVKAKEEFARKIDQVRAWVASGDAVSAPESYSSLIALYASYSVWAERTGKNKVNEQEFSDRLEGIGLEMTEDQGQVMFKGLMAAPLNAARQSVDHDLFGGSR